MINEFLEVPIRLFPFQIELGNCSGVAEIPAWRLSQPRSRMHHPDQDRHANRPAERLAQELTRNPAIPRAEHVLAGASRVACQWQPEGRDSRERARQTRSLRRKTLLGVNPSPGGAASGDHARPGCGFRRPRRKIVSAGRQPGHAGRVCSPAKEPCGVSFCHFDGFNYHVFALRDDRPTLAHLLIFYYERLRRRTIKGLRFKN